MLQASVTCTETCQIVPGRDQFTLDTELGALLTEKWKGGEKERERGREGGREIETDR